LRQWFGRCDPLRLPLARYRRLIPVNDVTTAIQKATAVSPELDNVSSETDNKDVRRSVTTVLTLLKKV
jgi:hypothetical protein